MPLQASDLRPSRTGSLPRLLDRRSCACLAHLRVLLLLATFRPSALPAALGGVGGIIPGAAEGWPIVRWLLLALALLVAGCSPATTDPLPSPSPQPTRPTLSLPTHAAARTALPRIPSSWDLTQPPRTPFSYRAFQSDLTPSEAADTPTVAALGQPSPTSAPTATRTPPPSPTAHAHRFVVSTRARSYYYCDTDSGWKSLSAANLRWYDDERALKADYPRLTLHEPCE